MSKQIYVQAQADHIASLAKAPPLAALEELVWNALDADAHEVKVDLLSNALGAVEAVRVTDDGSGIDVLRADSTFGSLGGSWKRAGTVTEQTHRRLHGQHGRGRFKAFALGCHVEWRTVTKIGADLFAYKLTGELENPGLFELDSAELGERVNTGTEVLVTNVKSTADSLLDAAESVQALASRFALYLKSYPDVSIYFNGIPVTPVIVQRRTSEFPLALESGVQAKLEIIEWKRKFVGSGRLILSGPDGFELHSMPAGVRAGGASFTAYLVSPRFPALNAENALVMDELNPEVRAHLDAAKKALKAHFAKMNEDTAASRIGNWMHEGSYPFDPDDATPARERFDALALELSGRFDDFGSMTPDEHAVIFKLLRSAMDSVAKGGLKEILK